MRCAAAADPNITGKGCGWLGANITGELAFSNNGTHFARVGQLPGKVHAGFESSDEAEAVIFPNAAGTP
jgi:hypothetical protein